MRFILIFAAFTAFGFAQQNCSRGEMESAVSSNSKPTATAASPAQNTVPPTSATPEEARRITLADAKKDFDAKNVVFVDTRGEASYKNEHIKGAINIPADAFQTRYTEVPKNKKIIAYCS